MRQFHFARPDRFRSLACSWVLVHKSAKFSAKSRGIKPYSNLVALLKSGDVDTSVNTLTLLNSLIGMQPASLIALCGGG